MKKKALIENKPIINTYKQASSCFMQYKGEKKPQTKQKVYIYYPEWVNMEQYMKNVQDPITKLHCCSRLLRKVFKNMWHFIHSSSTPDHRDAGPSSVALNRSDCNCNASVRYFVLKRLYLLFDVIRMNKIAQYLRSYENINADREVKSKAPRNFFTSKQSSVYMTHGLKNELNGYRLMLTSLYKHTHR